MDTGLRRYDAVGVWVLVIGMVGNAYAHPPYLITVVADKKRPGDVSPGRFIWQRTGLELVHRVMGATGFQGGFAGEIFLVVVTDVRA